MMPTMRFCWSLEIMESAKFKLSALFVRTGDFLGHDRRLSLAHGNLLYHVGAYGMSMSSNYNTPPRAAEVMIDKSTVHIIRQLRQLIN